MEDEDYSSDTSDEDYIPQGGEVVSEEEDSGDDEELLVARNDDDNDAVTDGSQRSAAKKKGLLLNGKKPQKNANRTSTLGVCEQPDRTTVTDTTKKQEDTKKRADDLWTDFLKDVGQTSKSTYKSTQPDNTTQSVCIKSPSLSSQSQPSTTVQVTKEFDFAGETVRVVKEVAADSIEAKAVSVSSRSSLDTRTESTTATTENCLTSLSSLKRPASNTASGLTSVLGKIGKKSKISVLDKSKLDWNHFKDKEGISEELQTHNRGKAGYLERQAFLQRTDVRQFELERVVRLKQSTSLPPPTQH